MIAYTKLMVHPRSTSIMWSIALGFPFIGNQDSADPTGLRICNPVRSVSNLTPISCGVRFQSLNMITGALGFSSKILRFSAKTFLMRCVLSPWYRPPEGMYTAITCRGFATPGKPLTLMCMYSCASLPTSYEDRCSLTRSICPRNLSPQCWVYERYPCIRTGLACDETRVSWSAHMLTWCVVKNSITSICFLARPLTFNVATWSCH